MRGSSSAAAGTPLPAVDGGPAGPKIYGVNGLPIVASVGRLLRRLAVVGFCAVAAWTPAQTQAVNVSGGPLRPGRACYDVKKYQLYLSVDPAQRTIEGICRMWAVALAEVDRFELDLDDALEVRKVEMRDKPVEFAHEDGVLKISPQTGLLPQRGFEVVVFYGGAPRVAPQPPWQGGFTWAETPDGQPWIATSCQGEGADLWWPCKDHPSDEPDAFDLFVTVPEGLFVASNGVLVARQSRSDGTERFHWSVVNPINNYGVALKHRSLRGGLAIVHEHRR